MQAFHFLNGKNEKHNSYSCSSICIKIDGHSLQTKFHIQSLICQKRIKFLMYVLPNNDESPISGNYWPATRTNITTLYFINRMNKSSSKHLFHVHFHSHHIFRANKFFYLMHYVCGY